MDLYQKISSSIHKIKTDWERSGQRGQGISRIDKDILTHDLRQLYDLVFELEIDSINIGEVVDKSSTKVDSYNGEIAKTPIRQEEVQKKSKIQENQIVEVNDIHQINEQQDKPEVTEPKIIGNEVSVKAEDTNQVVEVFVEKAMPEKEPSISKESIKENQQGVPSGDLEDKPSAAKKTLTRKPAKSTSEKFNAPKTFADIYQNTGDNSLATKIQKNSITDIKSAIGINDKFLFINEIFKGDSKTYHQAIETINNFMHFHEALEFIEHIKVEYKTENPEAITGLIEIIKRKYQ